MISEGETGALSRDGPEMRRREAFKAPVLLDLVQASSAALKASKRSGADTSIALPVSTPSTCQRLGLI